MRRTQWLGLVALFTAWSASGAGAVTLTQVVSIYADEKGVALKEPRGVGCNINSVVVVADTGNRRLVSYTFQGGAVQGGAEIRVGQIGNPVRVKLTSRGEIFVLEGKQRRIVHLSASGEFRGYVEPVDQALSSFAPTTFDIDPNDNLNVLDASSNRALILDPTGKTLRILPLPRGSGVFTDLAGDSQGTLFLVDSANAMVYSAAADATAFSPLTRGMKDSMSFPTNIATDSKGLLYVMDLTGGSIVLLAEQGGSFQGRAMGYGWNEGMLRYPSDLCVNGRGEAFIADRANSRVQVTTVVR